MKYEMLNMVGQYHELANEMLDLGSSQRIIIDIQGEYVRLSKTQGIEFDKLLTTKELGKEIAEIILLNCDISQCSWGSWLSDKKLPDYKEVLSFKSEDFELNIDLMKLWTISRIICNSDRSSDQKLYHIEWSEDMNEILVEEFDNKEDLKVWLEKALRDE